jgi:hypothetical protein
MTERALASAGVGFALALAVARIVDHQRLDAYVLGLATAFLVCFLGALRAWLRVREGEAGPLSATAVIAGSAIVALYGVITVLHITFPSDDRDINPWVFAASFPQAVLLLAAGLTGALPRGIGAAALNLAPVQLIAAALLLWEGTDAYGVLLSTGTFALWVAAAGAALAAREPRDDGERGDRGRDADRLER